MRPLNPPRLRSSACGAERCAHKKRLEAAHEALATAEAASEQDRRRALYEAGIKAEAEVERLLGEYAKHASAIAEVFRAIDKLRPPVEAANLSLPEGERRIGAYALEIHRGVELPAATKDGPKFWWRSGDWTPGPLDPPSPPIIKYIEFNGAFVPFDARNPAHLAVREAKPSTAMPIASKSPSQPVSQFGERTLPDGTRKIKLPPNEWPPKADSASN